jgi:hypothetical protein
VLLNVGQVEEAEAAIGRALALDPESGEALAQRAISSTWSRTARQTRSSTHGARWI